MRGVLSSVGGRALTSWGNTNYFKMFLIVAVLIIDYFFWSRWLGRLLIPLGWLHLLYWQLEWPYYASYGWHWLCFLATKLERKLTISIYLIISSYLSRSLADGETPAFILPLLRVPIPSEEVFSCLSGESCTWLSWNGWLSGCNLPFLINLINIIVWNHPFIFNRKNSIKIFSGKRLFLGLFYGLAIR